MKVEIESFETTNGSATISIAPAGSRRTKPNWYVWMKEDGSGILVIDETMTRVKLPANS